MSIPKWVDHFGGSGDSKATGMVVDKQSNVYVGAILPVQLILTLRLPE
ncbi:MAG: hypothetical protein ABI113_13135 [Mucilaginibacter sp.]